MEFTGKTVEEATKTGLAELGITEEEAVITVKQEAVKGLFGKIKSEAIVDIEKKEIAKENKNTCDFVQNILDLLNLTAKAKTEEKDEKKVISIIAEKSSEIIGHRGEVLDAIQTLAGAYENIGNSTYKKVVVDCENYRDKREETLIALAHKLEAKATDMRREVMLEAMNPYDRRIIHTALCDSKTVTTKSEGKEPNRYVIIVPNDKDEFSTPYNAGKNKGGFNNRDRRNKKSGSKSFSKSSFASNGSKKKTFSFGTYLGNSLKDKE